MALKPHSLVRRRVARGWQRTSGLRLFGEALAVSGSATGVAGCWWRPRVRGWRCWWARVWCRVWVRVAVSGLRRRGRRDRRESLALADSHAPAVTALRRCRRCIVDEKHVAARALDLHLLPDLNVHCLGIERFAHYSPCPSLSRRSSSSARSARVRQSSCSRYRSSPQMTASVAVWPLRSAAACTSS